MAKIYKSPSLICCSPSGSPNHTWALKLAGDTGVDILTSFVNKEDAPVLFNKFDKNDSAWRSIFVGDDPDLVAQAETYKIATLTAGQTILAIGSLDNYTTLTALEQKVCYEKYCSSYPLPYEKYKNEHLTRAQTQFAKILHILSRGDEKKQKSIIQSIINAFRP